MKTNKKKGKRIAKRLINIIGKNKNGKRGKRLARKIIKTIRK